MRRLCACEAVCAYPAKGVGRCDAAAAGADGCPLRGEVPEGVARGAGVSKSALASWPTWTALVPRRAKRGGRRDASATVMLLSWANVKRCSVKRVMTNWSRDRPVSVCRAVTRQPGQWGVRGDWREISRGEGREGGWAGRTLQLGLCELERLRGGRGGHGVTQQRPRLFRSFEMAAKSKRAAASETQPLCHARANLSSRGCV